MAALAKRLEKTGLKLKMLVVGPHRLLKTLHKWRESQRFVPELMFLMTECKWDIRFVVLKIVRRR